ncbi:MAG: SPOR domain-containing protein [Candidatus Omnitrophota bacterium]
MPAEYQEELFEEFKKEKGKFRKIADKITQRQPKRYIHVSLENIVFAAIIGIMCIVVAFALGVERGKRFTVAAGMARKKAPVFEKETPVSEPEAVTRDRDASDKETAFVIQLISYKQKRRAESEKKRLLDKKIDAFIMPSGRWHQVCAGGYSDISEARKALEGFKKDYKGSFIRGRAR